MTGMPLARAVSDGDQLEVDDDASHNGRGGVPPILSASGNLNHRNCHGYILSVSLANIPTCSLHLCPAGHLDGSRRPLRRPYMTVGHGDQTRPGSIQAGAGPPKCPAGQRCKLQVGILAGETDKM